MVIRLDIDPDIAQAATLPGWCYRDAEFFELCRKDVIARSWQLVPGAEPVRPFEVAGEPLVRTPEGCFSNVCTHRGMLVATEPGDPAELRCPYHGRRFGLDGRFRSMPEFDGVEGFPTEADDLARVAHAAWGPLEFASIDPAFPFDALWTDVPPPADWTFDGARDYDVAANWMLYVDNYLEGFHIPFVHGGLNAELDFGAYETRLYEWSNVQIGVDKQGGAAAHYFWLFPNLMLNFYPWGLSVNVVTPVAADRTRVTFLAYVSDASKRDEGAGADLDTVEREDEAIVEAVQRGVHSRFYERGRYSPTREQGVHHFHRLLAQRLTGS